MVYTKENLATDTVWLKEYDIDPEEAEEFILGLINKGFNMDSVEYDEFLESLTDDDDDKEDIDDLINEVE